MNDDVYVEKFVKKKNIKKLCVPGRVSFALGYSQAKIRDSTHKYWILSNDVRVDSVGQRGGREGGRGGREGVCLMTHAKFSEKIVRDSGKVGQYFIMLYNRT